MIKLIDFKYFVNFYIIINYMLQLNFDYFASSEIAAQFYFRVVFVTTQPCANKELLLCIILTKIYGKLDLYSTIT